jgi:hypothetical protein
MLPPAPTNAELRAAADERAAYFAWLNSDRSEPRPEIRLPQYWPEVGG